MSPLTLNLLLPIYTSSVYIGPLFNELFA